MNSAGDVDPGVTTAPEDELDQRAAAAARAFAALNIDGPNGTEPEPHHHVGAADRSHLDPGTVTEGPVRPDAVFHPSGPGADLGRLGPDLAMPGPTTQPPGPDLAMPGPTTQPPGPDLAMPGPTTQPAGPPAQDRAARPDPSITRPEPPATATVTVDEPTPPDGEHGGTRADAAAAGFDPPARAGDRHLLRLGSAALATGAFVAPWAWLFVVGVAVGVAVGARSLLDHGLRPGALARRSLAFLHPGAVARLVLAVTHGALLAVTVPAVLAMASWVTSHGSTGALVAGRIGIATHGLRCAAAIACYLLVAGIGPAHERRSTHLQQVTAHVSGSTVAALAAGAVAVAAIVVTVVPRADAGPLAGADGLAWVPAPARPRVDRLRDVVVDTELHAAASCLGSADGVTWHASYTVGNDLGERDVARLVAEGGTPEPGEVTTSAVALHNQLAPWVEAIEIATPERDLLVVDRGSLPSTVPLDDPDPLGPAAVSGRALVEVGAAGFDRDLALDCSLSPVL